jgi:hypothetical protein
LGAVIHATTDDAMTDSPLARELERAEADVAQTQGVRGDAEAGERGMRCPDDPR